MSLVGGHRLTFDKVAEVLNLYDHLNNFTHYTFLKELFNPKARDAFISMKLKRRRSWMDLVGNGY